MLFVTACTHSSGEAITALHTARALAARGIDCWFAASAGAARLLDPALAARVVALGESRSDNQARWREAMTGLRPDAIVFADYPLLFFASGSVPLADDAWVESLLAFPGALFTLDHFGYAQRSGRVFFGPPHLTFGTEMTAEVPARMEVLLPCPTHEPSPVEHRRGLPVRYWAPARPLAPDRLRELRRRHLGARDGVLVLHSTPAWASRLAAQLGLPHGRYTAPLLHCHLAGIAERVVVVMVNDGSIPIPAPERGVEFVRIPGLAPPDYEALLAAADLVLTDNAVSASLAKAACSLTPCALLRNTCGPVALLERVRRDPAAALALAMENERPGAIFPYDVFPVWDEAALAGLGFGYAGGYGRTFARLEAFDAHATRAGVSTLLFDHATRARLRAAQRDYVDALAALPSAADAIAARVPSDRADA